MVEQVGPEHGRPRLQAFLLGTLTNVINTQREKSKPHHAGGTGVAAEGGRVPGKKFIMKLLTLLLLVLSMSVAVFAQSVDINIIPKPKSVRSGDGIFVINKQTTLIAGTAAERKMALALNSYLKQTYGLNLKVAKFSKPRLNAIGLMVMTGDHALLAEEYRIGVTTKDVAVSAVDEETLFYGLQTLIQLIRKDEKARVVIPAVAINDAPRFKYRGMHLDVSRHFFSVEFVKKYIDLMSQYKFNTFHWHLTDDQGWRIEIKKYPKLTEIGSKRPESVKERNLNPYIGDGVPVEGFYTQDQIKDVIAYAKARYITVIPEIELPGHASAALAAYPQLGCKADYTYKVQTTWGIFKEVFCPTDETFKFLEDVLDETIALFPDSPYIHIGGDEVLKDHWKESPFVQGLMKRENLKDEHEVQSYFIRRIEKFINSKGKKIIGWDEILEGGLAPNATVMSWRGMKGGIEAAKAKHDVIMTPTDFVYFDYGQGDPAYEPLNIGSYVPLSKVYSFDPVPKELTADEAKYVIGGQANVWTEYIKTPSHVEYMAFPRAIALAEVLWSRPEAKNYADFTRRLAAHFPRLDKQKVNYRIPEPAGLQNFVVASDAPLELTLTPSLANAKIYYTTDGSTPDERSKLYDSPFKIDVKGERTDLKTITVGPTGRKSVVHAATIVRGPMLRPSTLAERRPGVNYQFTVPGAPDNSGETKSIQLNQFAKAADLKQPFAVTFDGYLEIVVDGVYELQIDSTWDATLVFGGRKIIDDAGNKDRKVRSALLPLRAGLHKISLRYNHRGGDLNFRFRYGIKGQGLRQAYGGEFFH